MSALEGRSSTHVGAMLGGAATCWVQLVVGCQIAGGRMACHAVPAEQCRKRAAQNEGSL